MKLSIVVVTFNVAEYIDQGLISIVEQSGAFHEIIVIDNSSTDETIATIRRNKVTRQSNFKLIVNGSNIGLGQARNQSLDIVTGDYVAFLDGDDWLCDKYLAAIVQKLNKPENADADILVFDHLRCFEDGTTKANPNANRMAKASIDAAQLVHNSTVEQKMKVAISTNLNVAWNKAYRRQFLLDNKLRFGLGFYEDLAFNYEVVLKSKKSIVLPDVLIFYRQRTGSILRSTDARHMDVLDEWRKVCKLFETNDKVDLLEFHIFNQSILNLAGVYKNPIRLPENLKKLFLEEAKNLVCNWYQKLNIKQKIKIKARKSFVVIFGLNPFYFFKCAPSYLFNSAFRFIKHILR